MPRHAAVPRLLPALLVATALGGCASSWQVHLEGFSVNDPCGDCSPVRGTVRSDQYVGALADSVYTLTNALVHLESGGRIEAERLTLNGATGRFVTDAFTGRVGLQVIELQAPSGMRLHVFAEEGGSADDSEIVVHGGRVSGGRSQITASRIHVRQY